MKVLLLGATGLLGHNVLQRLTDNGHQVVAVVRRRKSLWLNAPNVEVVEGDITVPRTVMNGAVGCDAIVNCAGVTDMSLRKRDYYAVNTGIIYKWAADVKDYEQTAYTIEKIKATDFRT